jgi:hypothetical protein
LKKKTGALLLVTGILAGSQGAHWEDRNRLNARTEKVCAYGHNPATKDDLFCWVELRPAGSPRIEEDDPRWDCNTMGNHVCGPAKKRGE